jgi:hypothetical protein
MWCVITTCLVQTDSPSIAMRMATVLLRISQDVATCTKLVTASNSTASLVRTLVNAALNQASNAPLETIGELGQTREVIVSRTVLSTTLAMNNILVTALTKRGEAGDEDAGVRD